MRKCPRCHERFEGNRCPLCGKEFKEKKSGSEAKAQMQLNFPAEQQDVKRSQEQAEEAVPVQKPQKVPKVIPDDRYRKIKILSIAGMLLSVLIFSVVISRYFYYKNNYMLSDGYLILYPEQLKGFLILIISAFAASTVLFVMFSVFYLMLAGTEKRVFKFVTGLNTAALLAFMVFCGGVGLKIIFRQ